MLWKPMVLKGEAQLLAYKSWLIMRGRQVWPAEVEPIVNDRLLTLVKHWQPVSNLSIAELICSEGLLTGNVVIFMCRFNDESVCNLSENNDHIS